MTPLAYVFPDGEAHVLAPETTQEKALADLERLFDDDDGAQLAEVEIKITRLIEER